MAFVLVTFPDSLNLIGLTKGGYNWIDSSCDTAGDNGLMD